ncbi:hypothetical protein [Methanocaldococcus sp.]
MVEFYASLTISPGQIRKMVELLKKHEPKKWAFENVIFTPIVSSEGTIQEIKNLKKKYKTTVMFDSGGYYVQQGKFEIHQLFSFLRKFYEHNKWGDWYVLPDSPPVSSDSVETAWGKVYETVYFAKSFAEEFNGKLEKKFVPVVQGINKEMIYYCVKNYADLNVRRLGFGSFGTCGKNNQINRLTKESLENLKYLSILAKDYGFELHAFGIGGPSSINKIRKYIDSFDSSSWKKAGGFGDVFLPNQRTINITGKSSRRAKNFIGYDYKFDELRNGHMCYFCNPIDKLKKYEINRWLHNIIVLYDMVKK